MHVEASEVLFNTQLRNEFCQNWEGSPVGSTQCMDKDKDFESWAGYRGLFHNISTCAQAAQRDDLGSPQFSRKSNSSMCEYSIVQLLCPSTCNACDSEEDKAQEATASGTYVFPTADEYFAFLLKEGSLSQEQYAYTFYSKTKYGPRPHFKPNENSYSSSWVKSNYSSEYLTCASLWSQPEECHSKAFCEWKPYFDTCVPISVCPKDACGVCDGDNSTCTVADKDVCAQNGCSFGCLESDGTCDSHVGEVTATNWDDPSHSKESALAYCSSRTACSSSGVLMGENNYSPADEPNPEPNPETKP